MTNIAPRTNDPALIAEELRAVANTLDRAAARRTDTNRLRLSVAVAELAEAAPGALLPALDQRLAREVAGPQVGWNSLRAIRFYQLRRHGGTERAARLLEAILHQELDVTAYDPAWTGKLSTLHREVAACVGWD